MKEKSAEEMKTWTTKQTYIALSSALTACAELNIDSTPVEGFEPEKYDGILGLSNKNCSASVVLAINYRNEDDAHQFEKKVRKPVNSIFETI